MKKTGIDLIAEERAEQLNKHKWSAEHDKEHEEGQLKMAAMYALQPYPNEQIGIRCYGGWDWFTEKMDNKTELQRLVVAGALIAAEIDRISKH